MTTTYPTPKAIAAPSLPLIRQVVPVQFTYDVHFTTGLFELNNPLLAQVIAADGEVGPKRMIVVVDSGVLQCHDKLLEQVAAYANYHHDILTLSTDAIAVPGGEIAKNQPEWVDQLHQVINTAGICRHSYVMAIGGGALLDMVGYAAATAHRGVRLIRVPTTVLSQDDSAVGVKNGINAFGKKNFLGTFAPPYAVLNDFSFLTTLDDRDWRSGMAEAVKVALIKDAEFYRLIETHAHALANRDMAAMQQLIYRCAQLHLDHIAYNGDPFEMGSARPLDFGHWAAHKLEHLTGYNLRHGEAVAIGIALDSTYAYLSGLLSQSEWQRILKTLQMLGFTLYVKELGDYLDQPRHPQSIFKGLTEFQEHLGGELSVTLLSEIGKGVEVHQVNLSLYQQAILIMQEMFESVN
ncbi:3-dehydroquinate synthase [Leptolyngbyaceae cyanobacterium UHCC 1019]